MSSVNVRLRQVGGSRAIVVGNMKKEQLIVIICLVLVGNQFESILAQEQSNLQCVLNKNQCRFSWECCSGCCTKGQCQTRSETCVQDVHPCEIQSCPVGSSCRLVPVNCLLPPCPPIKSCKSLDNPNPCSNFTCGPGFHCELNVPSKPTCAKDSLCDQTTCPRGSICVMNGKRPDCVPSCDKFDCARGSQCTLQLINGCNWDQCDLSPVCKRMEL